MRTIVRRIIFITIIAMVVYGVLAWVSPNTAQKMKDRILGVQIPFVHVANKDDLLEEILQKEASKVKEEQTESIKDKAFKATVMISSWGQSGDLGWGKGQDTTELDNEKSVPINSYTNLKQNDAKLSEEDRKKIEEMIYSLIK